jgi:hypothetical protein
MRLTAYRKLIDSANELPTKIEGSEYFKTSLQMTLFSHDPRRVAISAVLKMARKDTDELFHCEFIRLYKYSRKNDK